MGTILLWIVGSVLALVLITAYSLGGEGGLKAAGDDNNPLGRFVFALVIVFLAVLLFVKEGCL